MMYLNDLTVRFNLRLNPAQMKFLVDMSGIYGVSPSAYLRTVIDSMMIQANGGNDSHEDEQAIFDSEL